MVFNVSSGGTIRNLNLSSSVLFRQETDSGGRKYLSMEAINDSMKIIININDGIYPDEELMNDSIQFKTYQYSRNTGQQGGLVVAGVRTPTAYGYDYLQTDTSSVTITRINPKKKTVTGYYYFKAANNVKGEGVFQNTCYLSLTK
ncbi:MAG: hypothetical protein JO154_18245 [Chitinophaga sp.]|uniref:hypothetical protein n=1 Tax=Chitinophaga sp. TaxID=1869181 RepID=UPI0025C5FC5D|nr:hypothetical protein [Chitinophaga sp.]MBV8254548.1 hypothetical protein [Chitinophaga sp.]